jgi:hypothetical protein
MQAGCWAHRGVVFSISHGVDSSRAHVIIDNSTKTATVTAEAVPYPPVGMAESILAVTLVSYFHLTLMEQPLLSRLSIGTGSGKEQPRKKEVS